MFLIYKFNLGKGAIPLLIIQIIVYGLLSTIFYFMLSPKIIFGTPKIPLEFERKPLTESEFNIYSNNYLQSITGVKFFFILLFTSLILNKIFGESVYAIVVVFAVIVIKLYLIFSFIKNVAHANGYVGFSNMDVLRNFIIYYNPKDKRAVVDKPFGLGSTINFATKEGKIIFAVLISIPITILLIIFIVLGITGKL